MHKSKDQTTTLHRVAVWDRTTRLFHWVNVLCMTGLAALGLAILYEKNLAVSSDGKILLKTLHVYVGYVFAVNLGWRLIWAFIGSRTARWSAFLPAGRGFGGALKRQILGFPKSEQPDHPGHNPLGRLMISLLLALMLVQGLTGLVLAGTDLYKPPFGGAIASWVTQGDADKLANLTPGSKEFVQPAAYEEMRRLRKPVVTIHKFVFYILLLAVGLHVAGVIVAEFRERSGLVSAMVTGEKVLRRVLADAQSESDSSQSRDR